MNEVFGQIEKILTSRDLIPQIPLDETALVDDRRFLVIPCKDRQKGKWLFKIQVLPLAGLGKSFQNEVQFLRFAAQTEIAPFVPKLLDAGELEGNVWYLREFIAGQTLAASEEIFPYDPKILATVSPSLVARFFYDLSHLSVKEAQESVPRIKRHDLDWKDYYWRYLENNPQFLKNLKERRVDYLTLSQQRKLLNLLRHPPEQILTAYGWALNHDNLSPMNIIITLSGQPVFIDWENISVSFGTAHFDEFWSRSFLLPTWQAKLLKERQELEKDKERFLKVFCFALIFGNLGLPDYLQENLKIGKLTKDDYQLALVMWQKVMSEAIEKLAEEQSQ